MHLPLDDSLTERADWTCTRTGMMGAPTQMAYDTTWGGQRARAAAQLTSHIPREHFLVVKEYRDIPFAIQIVTLIQEAEFPKGVVNVLVGYGNTVGQAIAEHMVIQKTLSRQSTERRMVSCDSPEFATHLEKFTEKTRKIRFNVGNPFASSIDQGPVSQVQYERIMGYIESGMADGATVHSSGKRTWVYLDNVTTAVVYVGYGVHRDFAALNMIQATAYSKCTIEHYMKPSVRNMYCKSKAWGRLSQFRQPTRRPGGCCRRAARGRARLVYPSPHVINKLIEAVHNSTSGVGFICEKRMTRAARTRRVSSVEAGIIRGRRTMEIMGELNGDVTRSAPDMQTCTVARQRRAENAAHLDANQLLQLIVTTKRPSVTSAARLCISASYPRGCSTSRARTMTETACTQIPTPSTGYSKCDMKAVCMSCGWRRFQCKRRGAHAPSIFYDHSLGKQAGNESVVGMGTQSAEYVRALKCTRSAAYVLFVPNGVKIGIVQSAEGGKMGGENKPCLSHDISTLIMRVTDQRQLKIMHNVDGDSGPGAPA
ncbi:hypothetical protein GGX14DRAFT_610223 [Mycena pura]|uniref:Aldehyde dehydrogenase domain-containing protein n=1 Tax=Mycena pura TaxID=153505 RepID=A0AAD6VSN7_9AGAR|nr:hypothetical protein GGX14DRAFT_610223 [Mycena pura]